MNANGLIAIDVGGTSIKACIVKDGAMICEESVRAYPSMASAETSVILAHLFHVVQEMVACARDLHVLLRGIGFSFPGPFAYEEGICLISQLDKFEGLYGVNLRTELHQRILAQGLTATSFAGIPPIVFHNDADCFAIGESLHTTDAAVERIIAVTLGTGVGSAFVEHGHIVNASMPWGGRFHRFPLHAGLAEDYVSRRGILQVAAALGIPGQPLDVLQVAILADEGDARARQAFSVYGENLGLLLAPCIQTFQPDRIVIGGQISKSAHLFLAEVRRSLPSHFTNIAVSKDTLRSTVQGISTLFHEEVNPWAPAPITREVSL